MSNMSYCRFQNTAPDLDDCTEALQAICDGVDEDGEIPKALSKQEHECAHILIAAAVEIVAMLMSYSDGSISGIDDPRIVKKLCNALDQRIQVNSEAKKARSA